MTLDLALRRRPAALLLYATALAIRDIVTVERALVTFQAEAPIQRADRQHACCAAEQLAQERLALESQEGGGGGDRSRGRRESAQA